MSEFFLYRGRHGEQKLVEKTQAGWDFLIEEMERDNNLTFIEMVEDGIEFEGSFAEGRMFIDDGGRIDTIELTKVPANGYVHYH